jgi:GT2 family glycosyltransferase
MPVIYTIVVTYNGKKWLSTTLEALQRSSMSTRVLVVDNASTDGTVELVGQFENIELICLDSNLGFGAANNIGIRKAMENGAEFVFLLNQDAYVFEDTIEKLVTELKKAVFVGVLSPLQLATGGLHLDRAFSGYLKRAAKKMLPEQWVANLGNDTIRHLVPIRFVNAAAWLVRVDCIQKTGLFHPAFYHYGEDNNYAARLQYHGYHLAILPGAAVIHDRKQEPSDPTKEWRRKLQTIPLYTLLDIRKPRWLAKWLGHRKMNRLISRKPAGADAADQQLIHTMKAWFSERSGEVKKIRAAMKKEGCGL